MEEIVLRGIDPQRLIFGESLPRPQYLARYRAADLFLDTHPYNAGTTASDALRMGLPVLTFKGNSYPSRMAASILNSVNLTDNNIKEALMFNKNLLLENFATPNNLKLPIARNILESYYS